jgi:hypothetical protein
MPVAVTFPIDFGSVEKMLCRFIVLTLFCTEPADLGLGARNIGVPLADNWIEKGVLGGIGVSVVVSMTGAVAA